MVLFALIYVFINIFCTFHVRHRLDYITLGLLAPRIDETLFGTPIIGIYTMIITLIAKVIRFLLLIYLGYKTVWYYGVVLYLFAYLVTEVAVYYLHTRNRRKVTFRILSEIGFIIQPILIIVIWLTI